MARIYSKVDELSFLYHNSQTGNVKNAKANAKMPNARPNQNMH
jgi:hypothetical protein